MTTVAFSDKFFFVLSDGDKVWPCTVAGSFRLSIGGHGHNVLNEGEQNVSEKEMIEGVLKKGLVSRFRSRTNPKRMKQPNHFSTSSPTVVEVYEMVSGQYVKL